VRVVIYNSLICKTHINGFIMYMSIIASQTMCVRAFASCCCHLYTRFLMVTNYANKQHQATHSNLIAIVQQCSHYHEKNVLFHLGAEHMHALCVPRCTLWSSLLLLLCTMFMCASEELHYTHCVLNCCNCFDSSYTALVAAHCLTSYKLTLSSIHSSRAAVCIC
jgi:hypothetical protein